MPHSDTNPPAGSASSAEIDSRLWKMLYEFDRRLDEKFREARVQNKEDIKTAIEVAVTPIYPRLDNINTRLEHGEQRFEKGDKRLGEHSERIEDVTALLAAEGFGPNGRKPNRDVEITPYSKPGGGWISVDKLPAIIAAVGSVIAVVISSVAMLRSPNHQQTQPNQPVVSQPHTGTTP